MPGILVGVDGSDHSQRALEWAAREAAFRKTSLTVLAVHQAVHGWTGTLRFGDDEAQVQKIAEAAKAETDKVLAGLGDSRPESVTVRAVHGYPAEELINAGADADMIQGGPPCERSGPHRSRGEERLRAARTLAVTTDAQDSCFLRPPFLP